MGNQVIEGVYESYEILLVIQSKLIEIMVESFPRNIDYN